MSPFYYWKTDKFSILLVGEIITMLLYMVICVYSKLNQLSNQKSNECLAIACPNFIVLSIWGKGLVQVFSKSLRCFLIICHDFSGAYVFLSTYGGYR